MGEREAQGAGVLALLRSQLPGYTGALQRVATHVLSEPQRAARATIVELAQRSNTSPASITRFCRALGFDGYADLRFALAAETGPAAQAAGWSEDIGRQIEPDDPLDRVLGQIMAADTQAMRDTAALLDLGEVERAADALSAANRIDIYGASGSALVGTELQFSLNRLGLAAWSWPDVHNGLASASLLKPGDVAIGISHSGRTRETIEMLAEAGSRGAVTIALTGYATSPLAELADLVLRTASQPTTYRPDALSADLGLGLGGAATWAGRRARPWSARHPQLVVLDLLYIGVAQRTQAQPI